MSQINLNNSSEQYFSSELANYKESFLQYIENLALNSFDCEALTDYVTELFDEHLKNIFTKEPVEGYFPLAQDVLRQLRGRNLDYERRLF